MFAPPRACLVASSRTCSPQVAHHQFGCFFPSETHQTLSSIGKLSQCEYRDDIVTPPCPAGAVMRCRNSVLLIMISWTPPSQRLPFILSKAHSETITSVLTVFFYSSHTPLLRVRKPCFTILCVLSVSLQHFTCSKILSGWRFQLPLTLYSCLPFFFSLISEPFLLLLVLGKSIPTFLVRIVHFQSFSTAFHDAPFFSTTSNHCQFVSDFPLCRQILVVTLLA